MNRYQKAWNNVKSLAETSDYYKPYNDDKDIKLIGELVEKETPKKPDYEGDGYSDGELVYDTWICPCCGEHYEVDYDKYDYCPNCGQAIDWGEENAKMEL